MISKKDTPLDVLEDAVSEASKAFAAATGMKPLTITIGWITHRGVTQEGRPTKEASVLDVKVDAEPI